MFLTMKMFMPLTLIPLPTQLCVEPPLLLQLDQTKGATERVQKLITDITTIKLFQAAVIILVAYIAIRLVNKLIQLISERVPLRYRLLVKQSLPFWQALIFLSAMGLMIGLFVKLSRSNVIAVTGTAAVALGFAFKDLTTSIIAGLFALFERPYQVGDRVRVGEHYGEVISYGLRGFQIRTPTDDTVTIPHGTIWTEPVANANQGDLEAQVTADFYLTHRVDTRQVNQILYRVAQTSKYTQLQKPIVVVMKEQPWYTHFQLKAYPMDARDEFAYKTELTQQAKLRFSQCQIEYPRVPVAQP